MTFPISSARAGPIGVSLGGGDGVHSAGNVARTWISEEGTSEWIAGARMNTVLKGLVGLLKAGMDRGASKDSSWAKSHHISSLQYGFGLTVWRDDSSLP